MSDLELAATFLGGTCRAGPELGQARTLLRLLENTSDADLLFRELRIRGLADRQARSIVAGLHLLSRLKWPSLSPGQRFSCSAESFRHFRPRLAPLKKECFWSVLLNGKNRILKLARISEGSLTASLVHPREVFRPAILQGAAGILCVHNHPSGDPAPSQEDVQITRRLVETRRLVGIQVLDHVIISEARYFSFADQGMI